MSTSPYYVCAFRGCVSPPSAIEEAGQLAAFLDEAVCAMFNSGMEPSEAAKLGVAQAFALLKDKIAVGNGAVPAMPPQDGSSPWLATE